MSSIVEALPSVGVEGFSLTPLLSAAAAARYIRCSPDPTPGSGARDPEEVTADSADEVDEQTAGVVTAAG
jgi:hypothetical protein